GEGEVVPPFGVVDPLAQGRDIAAVGVVGGAGEAVGLPGAGGRLRLRRLGCSGGSREGVGRSSGVVASGGAGVVDGGRRRGRETGDSHASVIGPDGPKSRTARVEAGQT